MCNLSYGTFKNAPCEEEGRGLCECRTSGKVNSNFTQAQIRWSRDLSRLLTLCRKTGAVLKDTGVRDEHGLEPIDGIFSSPEKSPPKRNGISHNATITEDETMDLGESMSLELRTNFFIGSDH